MNNPAFMFGHSFSRIDQKRQTEQTRILAYTINQAAEVPAKTLIEVFQEIITGNPPIRLTAQTQ